MMVKFCRITFGHNFCHDALGTVGLKICHQVNDLDFVAELSFQIDHPLATMRTSGQQVLHAMRDEICSYDSSGDHIQYFRHASQPLFRVHTQVFWMPPKMKDLRGTKGIKFTLDARFMQNPKRLRNISPKK